jgi:HSP20 family protein
MYKINLNPNYNDLKPVASIFDELINTGLSSMLGAGFATNAPQVNILESDEAFTLELAAPGLRKEDFQLNVKDDTLTVSMEEKNTESDTDENYIRREYRFSSFKKSFQLPDSVDQGSIAAGYENGVLQITLPKVKKEERETLRTIEIK